MGINYVLSAKHFSAVYIPTKQTYLFLFGIALLGVVFSLLFGVVTGNIYKTEFGDYADDAESYNRMALNLLDRGSFADAEGTYYYFVRRSPGYPLLLAGAYAVARSPISAWVLNGIFFAVLVFLIYGISRIALGGQWLFIPAFLFSIGWFTATFVVRVGSDIPGTFLALLFLWSFFRHMQLPADIRFLLLSGVSLGAFALVRPGGLYFIPVAFVFLLFSKKQQWITVCVRAACFVVAALLVVAPWMWWSYKIFGTPQLASAGYMLAWRSQEAIAPPARLTASGIAAIFGDVVADYLFPGYADAPDPYVHVEDVFRRRVAMKVSGIPDIEVEAIFYREGIENMKNHPYTFLLTGIFNLFRLHTPPNLEGISMFHFLAESNHAAWLRLSLNLVLRTVWYAFLFIAVWGAVRYSKSENASWRIWGMPALFALYTVVLQALFTNPEFRYMLPLSPLYLIGFVLGIKAIIERFFIPPQPTT